MKMHLFVQSLLPLGTQNLSTPYGGGGGGGRVLPGTSANSYSKPRDSVLIFYCDHLAKARNDQTFNGQSTLLGPAHAIAKWI